MRAGGPARPPSFQNDSEPSQGPAHRLGGRLSMRGPRARRCVEASPPPWQEGHHEQAGFRAEAEPGLGRRVRRVLFVPGSPGHASVGICAGLRSRRRPRATGGPKAAKAIGHEFLARLVPPADEMIERDGARSPVLASRRFQFTGRSPTVRAQPNASRQPSRATFGRLPQSSRTPLAPTSRLRAR